MKKASLLLTLCLVLALAVPASAMETDPATFAQITATANWQIPTGYALESYLHGDLTADGQPDSLAAALINADGTHRLLAVVVANPTNTHAFLGPKALPARDAGPMGEDPFAGFTLEQGTFTLHTAVNSIAAERMAYTFGYHGSHFYLDTVVIDRWNPQTGEATRDTFELDIGHHTQQTGTMTNDLFTAADAGQTHAFDPHQAIVTLEDFDIATFPLDWAAFETFLASRTVQQPTQGPTRRPRPTYGPMPGPVYPTDGPMPGPVYPTPTPTLYGPIESEMPGPVYPTDDPPYGPLGETEGE